MNPHEQAEEHLAEVAQKGSTRPQKALRLAQPWKEQDDEAPEFRPCPACGEYFRVDELEDGYCAACTDDHDKEM